jgi:hypothetical protein
MPGTRRVKVNRENGEAYPVHTGLPGIIAGSGPTANALCGAVSAKGNCMRDPKPYREKVDVEGDRELQRTPMLTCILGRDAN